MDSQVQARAEGGEEEAMVLGPEKLTMTFWNMLFGGF